MKRLLPFLLITLSLAAPALAEPGSDWRKQVKPRIERLGHRNGIIVADSAYPIQTARGIQVFNTGADHLEVLRFVCSLMEDSKAVRPLIALDKEFAHLPEKHAPGAAALHQEILKILEAASKQPIRRDLHQTLLDEVGETAGEYEVVVLKTTGTIPYSSVFFTLDCGYWSAEAERELRRIMGK